MRIVRGVWMALAVAGLCLGASLYAGEGAPPGDRGGARPGPAEGGRGRGQPDGDRRGGAEGDRDQGPRDGGEPRGRPPEGLPLLGDVKGMKEEVEKHRARMRELQEQLMEILGKPGERKGAGKPPGGEARKDAPPPKGDLKAPAITIGRPGENKGAGKPQDDGARNETGALQAKVEAIASAIVDEFIRHYQAVAELLKANRAEAVEKLTEHMMNPPGGNRGPGGPGDGPAAKGAPRSGMMPGGRPGGPGDFGPPPGGGKNQDF